jgi:hypothetical protein
MDVIAFRPGEPAVFRTVRPVLYAAQWDGTREGVEPIHVALVAILEGLSADVERANHRVDTRDHGGPRIDYEIVREIDGLRFKFSIFPHNWVCIWEGMGWLQDIEVLGATDGDARFSAPIIHMPGSGTEE